MMINKQLIRTVKDSKKYIVMNVFCQWISLFANITLMFSISIFLGKLFNKSYITSDFTVLLLISIICISIRFLCINLSSKMSYMSSKTVKLTLREMIFKKLLRLGTSYNEKVKTSEVIQVAVEGVDQLDTYFGAYLPQFFYAILAPITLFVCLSFVNFLSAVVLLICVPLIPVSIALVQTWAKKLLSKYWGQYTELGDTFLENLQGLNTLKIYQSDKYKNDEMNKETEKFRKITMKVLTMQLNSITVMDLIAYGGASLGMILSVSQFSNGNIDLSGCLLIILLSADFFLPMRQLGSYFHIAMNGMAASDKIFNLLKLSENHNKGLKITEKDYNIKINNLSFSYEENKEILHNINMEFPKGKFIAIVGESGCGKSTIASILIGKNKNYKGSVKIGKVELSDICEESLMSEVTYIGHDSYLFKGTVRDNLLMGKNVNDMSLWNVLDKVNLSDFLKSENGLDTKLQERASNFSGGQRQRLALARAILHDSSIYIFDESTSNIDVESENDILQQIYSLAKHKTVIIISHRLANIVNADNIYVIENGSISECGNHNDLLRRNGVYAKLYNSQQSLENFVKVGDNNEKKK